MPSKPWLENACPTQNYNVRTAELQLVQVLAAILTAPWPRISRHPGATAIGRGARVLHTTKKQSGP